MDSDRTRGSEFREALAAASSCTEGRRPVLMSLTISFAAKVIPSIVGCDDVRIEAERSPFPTYRHSKNATSRWKIGKWLSKETAPSVERIATSICPFAREVA